MTLRELVAERFKFGREDRAAALWAMLDEVSHEVRAAEVRAELEKFGHSDSAVSTR